MTGSAGEVFSPSSGWRRRIYWSTRYQSQHIEIQLLSKPRFLPPSMKILENLFVGALFFAFAFRSTFSVFIELFKLARELDVPASRLVPIGPDSLDRFAGIVNLLFKQEFLTFEIGKRFTKDIQILPLRGLRQKMLPSSVLLGGRH